MKTTEKNNSISFENEFGETLTVIKTGACGLWPMFHTGKEGFDCEKEEALEMLRKIAEFVESI